MSRNYILVLVMSLFLTGCQSMGSSSSNYIAPDPKAAELNMRLGLNYLQRGDYEIALDKLEKALKQDPGLSPAHNTIAVLHQRLGQDDKAEHHFKQAIRYEPTYSEAHNNFGVFLCQAGRYKEAEQSFLEAVKNPLYRSTARAYENAGLCVSRIPDPVLAKSYLRKALQFNPNLSKSLLQMSELHYDEQDYLRARAYIERYRTGAAWSPRALLLAIKIEKQLEDQNAVSSYRVLLKGKFPDSDEALLVETGNF